MTIVRPTRGRCGNGENILLPNLAKDGSGSLKMFDPLSYSLKVEHRVFTNPITGEVTRSEINRRRPAYVLADDKYDDVSDTF